MKLVLYYVNKNSYPKFDVNILKDDREVQKTKFKQKQISGVQLGQTQYKLNLICIMSRQIHIPNVKSISQKKF